MKIGKNRLDTLRRFYLYEKLCNAERVRESWEWENNNLQIFKHSLSRTRRKYVNIALLLVLNILLSSFELSASLCWPNISFHTSPRALSLSRSVHFNVCVICTNLKWRFIVR